jgi:hypothetical protein
MDYTLGRFIINGTTIFIGLLGFICINFVRKDFICWFILILYIAIEILFVLKSVIYRNYVRKDELDINVQKERTFGQFKVFQVQNLLVTLLFNIFGVTFRQRWKEILILSCIAFFATQLGVQLILSNYVVGTIAVEIGMEILFVCIFMFITYTSRLNHRKAFEMTIRAEKASETVNNIFDSLPDSILLIRRTKNDLSTFNNNSMKLNNQLRGPNLSIFNF